MGAGRVPSPRVMIARIGLWAPQGKVPGLLTYLMPYNH